MSDETENLNNESESENSGNSEVSEGSQETNNNSPSQQVGTAQNYYTVFYKEPTSPSADTQWGVINSSGEWEVLGQNDDTELQQIQQDLLGKQDTLIAGTNITIQNNVISASGGGGGPTYTAGNGINISNDEISVDTTVVATQTDLGNYQPTLTAGTNININSSNNTISATDTTYTNGTGLSLSGTQFSVDTTVIATKTDLNDYQTKITSSAKLDSDLVDDTNSSNKFVTPSQITDINTIGTISSNLTTHTSNTNNPHNVTKSQVGLGSVVNTGDSDNPVSGGTTKFTTGGAYTELAKKQDVYSSGSAEWDTAPTNNSTNPVTSGGIYTALSGKVDTNTAITGNTKCKITYDSKGLVTAGADLQASDIPDLSSTYQPKLSTQTAYTAQGSATKVPQITTNTLGQVTGITEVSITDNNDNQTIKGNGTTFGANDAINIVGGGAVSVTGDTTNKTITISAPSVTDTNQTVKTSSVTFGSDDAVEIVGGSNITVTGDATNKTITIDGVGDTHYTNSLTIQGNGSDAVVFTQNSDKTLNIKGSGATSVSKTNDGEITVLSTNTTYTAGTNIQIDGNNQISATDTTYTNGTGLNLNGTEFSVDTTTIATRQFVNSSIATNTATFRGTYNIVSDLGLTTSATEQQIASALATKMTTLGITPTNNDYTFVAYPDAIDPTQFTKYDRYKYNGDNSVWEYEFTLNNSSFTAQQWSAINSGITSNLVTQIGTNQTDISNIKDGTTIDSFGDVETALSGKVNSNNAITGATKTKITYDSKGLVTSGGDLQASDIPNLDASKITSGTFNSARIPSLPYLSDSTKYGASLSVNGTSVQLKDQDGNNLGNAITTQDTTYTSESASQGGTAVSLVTTGEKYTWNSKQDALATQTAYTSQGSATKVPQITTNTLGQVTSISETNIDYPVTDVQVNGTSILSSGVGNLLTNTAYNASTNKIATMSDIPSLSGYLPLSAGSSKSLTGDLYFNANSETQIIWQTSGTTTGLIRSGVYNSENYIVEQADKFYFGSIANTNRLIFDPINKVLYPQDDSGATLGSSTRRWSGIHSNGDIIAYKSALGYNGFIIRQNGYTLGSDGSGSTAVTKGLGTYGLKDSGNDWITILESRLTNYKDNTIANNNLHLGVRQATSSAKTAFKNTFLDLFANTGWRWIVAEADEFRSYSADITNLGTTGVPWKALYTRLVSIKNRDNAYSDTPSSSTGRYLAFTDKNDTTIADIHTTVGDTWNALNLFLRNKANDTQSIEFVHYPSSNIWNFDSVTDNLVNLGTPARRWKNIYLSGNIGDGTNTFTLPSSTGTLALTSSLDNYLPLSAGSSSPLTGSIYYSGGGRDNVAIRFKDGDANGTGVIIGDGGLVHIGAGESASSGNDATWGYSGASEQLYLTSDNNIYFASNCNTIANRKIITLNNSGNLYPNGTNQCLGVPANRWTDLFMTGMLAKGATGVGNCSTVAGTAVKEVTITNFGTNISSLSSGNVFVIYITNANSVASALTLKINDLDAKPIYINNAASSATNYTLSKGWHTFYYNGTNFYTQDYAISGFDAGTAMKAGYQIPVANGSWDLGVYSYRWKNLYLAGSAYIEGSIIKGSYTYTLPSSTGTLMIGASTWTKTSSSVSQIDMSKGTYEMWFKDSSYTSKYVHVPIFSITSTYNADNTITEYASVIANGRLYSIRIEATSSSNFRLKIYYGTSITSQNTQLTDFYAEYRKIC